MSSAEDIKKEYQDLLNQLSDPELASDWEKFEKLSKRKEKLEKIIEKQKEIDETKHQIEENRAILKGGDEQELISLAQTEILQLQEKEKVLEKELEKLLKKEEFSETETSGAVIMEIRAGTGGDEAALFAEDLFRMYSKYAVSKGWQQKILDFHPTELGGFKEVIFEIKPSPKAKENVFALLKYEGGVHRVQRIPRTEKSGRIHTSTATVAVLLKPKPAEIKIKPSDLKITTYKASGPGGQYVQKTESAVRIVHIPTGLIVASQSERNQLQNKENAMAILAARLWEREKEKAQSKIAGKRKSQIGSAKRAEKIRTYNFPQDRITDHRIGKSWHDMESIMAGKMEGIVKAFRKVETENKVQ